MHDPGAARQGRCAGAPSSGRGPSAKEQPCGPSRCGPSEGTPALDLTWSLQHGFANQLLLWLLLPSCVQADVMRADSTRYCAAARWRRAGASDRASQCVAEGEDSTSASAVIFWRLLCCLCYVLGMCRADMRALQAPAPAVMEEEADVLDLDAIFRRTTEEPALYWLPLTEEQAAARAAAKAKPSSDVAQNDKGPQQNGSVTDVKARP